MVMLVLSVFVFSLAQRDSRMILLKKSFTSPKIFMLFLGVLGFTPLASAADIAGRVTFALGEVVVSDDKNNKRSVFKGDLIRSGEKIETANNGRVQVRMTDGGTIVLSPNSVFEITRYSFSKDNPAIGTVLFNFLKGGARAISGAIAKANRENYQFKTPVATIGIRGTDYSSTLKNEQLMVTVSQGQVNIANAAGQIDATEGKTYAVSKDQQPTLCDACPPVVTPLETEEGIQISQQIIKKPNADNFATYGSFADAMRRYELARYELSLSENNTNATLLPTVNNTEPDTPSVITRHNNAFFGLFLSNNLLNNTEMRDSSVIDAIGFTPVLSFSLLDNIHNKDSLTTKVFNDVLSEDIVFETGNALNNAKLKENIDAFFETFSQNLLTAFLGNNATVTGVDSGSPDIDVILGNTLLDGISINLGLAKRTTSHLSGLGVSDKLLASVDKNKNAILRGISFKQAVLHDNDGIETHKNSGSIILGDGSAQQATVVFADDTTPIAVKISTDDTFNQANNLKSVINIEATTPKLVIKLGDVYVSNSDSSAENINKDGGENLGAAPVLGTSQDGAKAVRIMGASEVVLGSATINAKLEHDRSLSLVDSVIQNDFKIIPELTIFADVFIQEGLAINNLKVMDVDGAVKGGSIMLKSLKITDHASPNLSVKLAVNIEKQAVHNTLGGLLLTLEQLGNKENGLDLVLSNLSFGSDTAQDIGDVEVIGLNIGDAKIVLRGH